MAEQFLTVEQAASRLQVHPITVRRHLQKGLLRGIKQGRLWRVAESALSAPPVSSTPKETEEAVVSPILRVLAMIDERDARTPPVTPRVAGVNDAAAHIKEVREGQTP